MKRCCRSVPRCASCPARAVGAAPDARAGHATCPPADPASLVAEILAGRRPRELPQAILDALGALRRA